MPPPLVDIEQLDCCKLLGVIFQSNFKMASHIQFILSQCAQRLYLLKLLRHMVCPMLNYQLLLMLWLFHVFCMPCLYGEGSCLWNLSTKLMFFSTSAAFWLFSVSYDCRELNMNKSDHDLFCKLCAPTHALNHLLPPTRNRASLRTRGHSYQLPEYSTDLHKKSFLIRCLYSFMSSEIVFGFAAFYCTSFWLCFLCLLFDVRLLYLINITYIHTYIHT